jgi:hypothetical protein
MGEAVTFGLTTLGRMTLCILTFRIMLLGIINLFNNAQQIITTLCLMRINRMTVSIMPLDNNTQHNDNQHLA